MSHELRTPLNSLLILAKLLADNPADNLTEEQVSYAQTIQSAGNDLLTLINDILDLSKIEAGHMEIKPEPVVADAPRDDLPPHLLADRRRRKISNSASKSDRMPALDRDRPAATRTDSARTSFRMPLSSRRRARWSSTIHRAPNARIAFSVLDTGIGIPEDHQKAVFEPFRQADGTTNRKYGGTGLGLSISRELVRLLGGAIDAPRVRRATAARSSSPYRRSIVHRRSHRGRRRLPSLTRSLLPLPLI